MSNDTTKLSPHTTWLFSFGAVAAGIGSAYALSGMGQKVTAAVYFAIVAIGGFLSTYLTKARVRGAVLSFLTAGAVAAAAYFFLVSSIFSQATSALNDAQGAAAGAKLGNTLGMFVAGIVFLETIVAGIGGAIAGDKARGSGGLAALTSAARAAR